MIVMVAAELQVLRFIAGSPSKVTFGSLKRHFDKTNPRHPIQLKQVIAGLIQSGQLCYTSHYGRSFIEISYDHPHAASEHVIIKPPLCSVTASPGQCVVSLGRGAAFGGGEHPTTRLAIQLIDALLHLPEWQARRHACRAIDIGTGSGVLAVVAAKMGVGWVCGIDTDPCAVFEARDNMRLNQVETRVSVLNADVDGITGSYDLVFANLRMPTLFGLWPALEKKIAEDSMLVFSGLKTEETAVICKFYAEAGFFIHQYRSERGWTACCLARRRIFDAALAPMSVYGPRRERSKTGFS
jgi:ribosomal protein L11 methyltransferase